MVVPYQQCQPRANVKLRSGLAGGTVQLIKLVKYKDIIMQEYCNDVHSFFKDPRVVFSPELV